MLLIHNELSVRVFSDTYKTMKYFLNFHLKLIKIFICDDFWTKEKEHGDVSMNI